uniref:uncharacterized protein si:dkey-154b15.1 n=1 Tax=Scatophagus argus TaxID=75038 RepID=UPI001ED81589|nr:uncharacterized protein si:dkey-154b15.1 [Scatophagus argus]
MDFPVEATVHLNIFPNEAQVRKVLRSHGFELTDLNSDQVRVKGSFLKLRAAKAVLEPLVSSQTKMDITPSSSSPVPEAYSGAISKHYYRSDGNRSRLGSQNKALHTGSGSSNGHPTSPQYSSSISPRQGQHCSLSAGKESFVIDADVFDYAKQLRNKDIHSILEIHNVRMKVRPVCDSYSLTLQGKSVWIAVDKLQSLLIDLSKSLRTQEVPLKGVSQDGKALLERIQTNRNVYNSVLVCPKNDRLHLIGPSGESYELKQTLLGRPVYQSGRTGRTLDKNSRRRSSSLPPIHQKNTERDHGAVANSSPAKAAGYSPEKYQDVNQKTTEAKRGAADLQGLFRIRSQSEPRKKTVERTNGNMQDVEDNRTPKSPKKGLPQLLKINSDNIKQRFKNMRR